MSVVRESTLSDGPALCEFLLRTPIEAGGTFVLDRNPDFFALLKMRGDSRTFLAFVGTELAGIATALWHDVPDGGGCVRVGEVVDLRVADWARGGPTAVRLLTAVRTALERAGAQWVVCLIGDRNRATASLIRGGAGLPALRPLSRYLSAHIAAIRYPLPARARSLTVQEATGDDDAALRALLEASSCGSGIEPALAPWPDLVGTHRAWLARDTSGQPSGALIVWNAEEVRRIRVSQYRGGDRLFRAAISVAAAFRLASPLPPPGGVLRLWASRWLAARGDTRLVVRTLLAAALRQAASEGVHVVQINLAENDSLRRTLPAALQSVFWTTLYGCALTHGGECDGPVPRAAIQADIARV